MPPQIKAAFLKLSRVLLAFFVLAALICDAAAGLACRLAGCLALAASAVLSAAAEVSGAESIDVLSFHFIILQLILLSLLTHLTVRL